MGESKRNRFIKIIIYLVVILFILTLALTITINFRPLFRFSLKHLTLEETSGLDKNLVYKNFKQLMNYLNNPFIKNLKMDDFPSSQSGEFHFYEVKKLFLLNYAVLIITFIFLLISKFTYIKKIGIKLKDFRKAFLITGLLPFLGIIFVFIDFNLLFLKFHEVLFNNDMWLFDPRTDPIINVLPQEFFSYCFIFGLVLFEVLTLGMAVFGFIQNKKDLGR